MMHTASMSFGKLVRNQHDPSLTAVLLEVHDRLSGIGDVRGIVLVTKTESSKSLVDGKPLEASLRLAYEQLGRLPEGVSKEGDFSASYSSIGGQRICLTGGRPHTQGAVFLNLDNLNGQRVGTYLMNQVVGWAKQWPEAQITPIKLLAANAKTDANRARRNRLYEQFGIAFDYDSPAKKGGESKPMRAGELHTVDPGKENIVERPVTEWIADVLKERDEIIQEAGRLRQATRELFAEIRGAERRPIRWALKKRIRQLFWRLS